MKELLIPGTVKEVGAAFDSCIQLKTIRLSEGVEAIGDEAFSFAGSGNGSEGEYVTYLTDEAYEKNKAYVYQADEKANLTSSLLVNRLSMVIQVRLVLKLQHIWVLHRLHMQQKFL